MTEPTGRYEVLRELGRGGMGAVYLGLDRQLQRQVAIKRLFLQADPDLLARFQREAELMSRITHPGVARLLDVVLQGPGAPFLVLELIEGRDLSDLRRARPFFADETVRLLSELCDAVAAAHALGIIHRDLKPANVMLRGDGRVVVLDFGVARSVLDERRSLTQTGELLGTAAYMAPEQALGRAGPASDQYSLGGILYHCLTGRHPFEGSNALGILAKAANEPPLRPREIDPDVDPTLEAIALRALAKAPEDRFPDVNALGDAIRAALDEPTPSSRRPALIAVPLVLAALVGVAAVALPGGPPAPKKAPPTPSTATAPTPTPTPAEVAAAPEPDLSPLRARLDRLIAAFAGTIGEPHETTVVRQSSDLARALEQAQAEHPRSAGVRLLAAEHALRTAQTDRAVRLATEATTLEGGPAAQNLLARALLDQAFVVRMRSSEFAPARVQAALDAALRALDKAPDSPLRRSQRALAQRMFVPALEHLPEPGDSEARYLRCVTLLLQQTELNRLAKHLVAAVRRTPCDPRLRLLLAARRNVAGDDRIEGDLAFVTRFGAETVWALAYWAEALVFRRQFPRARSWLARAKQLAPTYARGEMLEARILAVSGEHERAIARTRRLLKDAPEDHELHALLGFSARNLGDSKTAEAHLARAVELRPDWPHHWLQLGVVRRRLGRLEPALKAYQEYLKRSPRRPDAWVSVSELQGQLGRHAEAEQSASRALRSLARGGFVPPNARDRRALLREAHYNRASARTTLAIRLVKARGPAAARSTFEAAIGDYTAALRIDPDMARAYEGRGRVLIHLGRRKKGALDMEQFLRLTPPRNADQIRRQIAEILGRPSRY